jgi:hypothetical protein
MRRAGFPILFCFCAIATTGIAQDAPSSLSKDVTAALATEWAPNPPTVANLPPVAQLMKSLDQYSRAGLTDKAKTQALTLLESAGNKDLIDIAQQQKLNLPYLLATAALADDVPVDQTAWDDLTATVTADIKTLYQNNRKMLAEVSDQYTKGNYQRALFLLLQMQMAKPEWGAYASMQKAAAQDSQAVTNATTLATTKQSDFDSKDKKAGTLETEAKSALNTASSNKATEDTTTDAREKTYNDARAIAQTAPDSQLAQARLDRDQARKDLFDARKKSAKAAEDLQKAQKRQATAQAARDVADRAKTALNDANGSLKTAQDAQKDADADLNTALGKLTPIVILMESYRILYSKDPICLLAPIHQMYQ